MTPGRVFWHLPRRLRRLALGCALACGGPAASGAAATAAEGVNAGARADVNADARAAATADSGIYVFRNEPTAAATALEVLIDGERAGYTKAMSHLFKPVAPGRYVVTSLGGARDTLEVTVQPGAVVYVWQEVKPTYRAAPRTVLRLVGDAEGKRAVGQTVRIATP